MGNIETKETKFEVGSKIEFVSYYSKLGDIQVTNGKDGLSFKTGEVTKLVPGYILYRVEGEAGERKCNIKFANVFRDFGTSIYGIFNVGFMEQKDYIETIIEKLEQRVLETYKSKSDLIIELNKVR